MLTSIHKFRWVNRRTSDAIDSKDMNMNPVRRLLAARGIPTAAMDEFLNPEWEGLHDPHLLKDLTKAVSRIEEGMAHQASIWIYGDYDVDGITSVSLLLRCFEVLDYPVQFYIPDRHEEGYGLNLDAIQYLADQKADLIITVDCGITSVKEALLCQDLGIDLIITDHHECQSVIPAAFAVINPKQADCQYPYNMLAGVGIAFKIAQALLGDVWVLHRDALSEFAAFGTIADIAPLTGENRILAKKGLASLNQTENPGFKALIQCSGLEGKPISSGQIGFVLAPKINAAGRIDDPKQGVLLLTSPDHQLCNEIATLLKDTNDRRQAIEKEILQSAIAQVEADPEFQSHKITLVKGLGWNSGVIGIVASRLVERYRKPAIVFAEVDGFAKGSARSIEGFDIFEALSEFNSLYLKFGGHEQAAGLTVPIENWPIFESQLKAYCQTHLDDYLLIPVQHIDEDIEISDITHQLLEDLVHMEPHGMGNPKPVFRIQDIRVDKKIPFGKQKEFYKLELSGQMRSFEALSFDTNGLLEPYRSNDLIDILFNLEMNSFRGMETIQFMLKDIRGSKQEQQFCQRLVQSMSCSMANQILRLNDIPIEYVIPPLIGNPKCLLSPSKPDAEQILIEAISDAEPLYYHLQKHWDRHLHHGIICWHRLASEAVHFEYQLLVDPDWQHPHPPGLDSKVIERTPDLKLSKLKNGIPDRDTLVTLYKELKAEKWQFISELEASQLLGLAVFIDTQLVEVTDQGEILLLPTHGQKVDILASPALLKLQAWQRS